MWPASWRYSSCGRRGPESLGAVLVHAAGWRMTLSFVATSFGLVIGLRFALALRLAGLRTGLAFGLAAGAGWSWRTEARSNSTADGSHITAQMPARIFTGRTRAFPRPPNPPAAPVVFYAG